MYDIPNSSYSAKGIIENYSVEYGNAMLEVQHGGRKPVETSGVYFGPLKTFLLSVKLENVHIVTSLEKLVTQNANT